MAHFSIELFFFCWVIWVPSLLWVLTPIPYTVCKKCLPFCGLPFGVVACFSDSSCLRLPPSPASPGCGGPSSQGCWGRQGVSRQEGVGCSAILAGAGVGELRRPTSCSVNWWFPWKKPHLVWAGNAEPLELAMYLMREPECLGENYDER